MHQDCLRMKLETYFIRRILFYMQANIHKEISGDNILNIVLLSVMNLKPKNVTNVFPHLYRNASSPHLLLRDINRT